ncbi:MAG: hypothetical protein AAF561_05740 [Planctomycetota bacterium]
MRFVVSVVLLLVATGCRPGASSEPLTDSDPIFVIPAVADLSDDGRDGESNRALFDLLSHPDAAVRGVAASKLRARGFADDAGYRYWADERVREDSVERWRSRAGVSGAEASERDG